MSRSSRLGVPALFVMLAVGLGADAAPAQYFGRNQVQYERFDFQVLQTEHFDIYYYEEEKEAAEQAGIMAERWYARLSRLLNHQLRGRQVVIYYASHPHFEQTNAIGGPPGESTGGVTEVFKRRIVLPFAGPLKETDHVLGHELVHAFQFDMTGQGRTVTETSYPVALRMPLWFIEGMAEYLSVGPADPHTAMWIRDAAANDRLPSITQLYDPRYFPYRFGQAFWAYVAGRWGDDVVGRILNAAGRTGAAEQALQMVLRIPVDSLVDEWHESIRESFDPIQVATKPPTDYGRLLLSRENAGGLNSAPALSADGTQLVFMSEKDIFAVEMFLADANTGQVDKKLIKTSLDPHYESLQFINSAGSWNPTGDRFVVGAVVEGQPVLSILEVPSGRTVREVPMPELGEIINPTWAPDGRYVAFSAIVGGFSDLYIYDIELDSLRRITNDGFADLQPAWSPDGSRIAFVTDRFSSNLETLSHGNYRLALYYPDENRIAPAPSFAEVKNINPQWSPDGQSLYFVSDRHGISNVYRMELASGQAYQITNLFTGVSGITGLSPALASASDTAKIVYGVFEKGDYNLYSIDDPALLAGQLVAQVPTEGESLLLGALDDEEDAAPFVAGVLPPANRDRGEIDRYLQNTGYGLVDVSQFADADYKPSLSLDFISRPYFTAGTDRFGTFVGGGASAFWSDMLGRHNLATMFQINGSLKDIAAIVGYTNKRSRWNWGVVGGQIVYSSQRFFVGLDQSGTVVETRDLIRQTSREFSGVVSYPFSRVQRVEFSGGIRHLSFSRELQQRGFNSFTGQEVIDERLDLPFGRPLSLATSSAALVYDNSLFGATSPILGQRYRLEASPTLGSLDYVTLLADARKYVMPVRPFTIAARVTHLGRYGADAEDNILQDLYIGYPSLVRGYDFNSFSLGECTATAGTTTDCPVFDQLFGSRIMVGNLELRFPLFGALGLGQGMFGIFPVEFAVFGDAGLAWGSGTPRESQQEGDIFIARHLDEPFFLGGPRDPVFSTGMGFRINLFGFLLAEIDYVRPHNRPLKGWHWQFSFQPGF